MPLRSPKGQPIPSAESVRGLEEAELSDVRLSGQPERKSLLTSAATATVESNRAEDQWEVERVHEPDSSINRRFYLPRLKAKAYLGFAVVHWTLTMEQKSTGWLTPSFNAAFREMMLHAQVRENLLCPLYCLMPDHLHLIWMGVQEDSDQRKGMAFLCTHLKPVLSPARFQHQPHDHVLREDERMQHAFENACRYIATNPVEAYLVNDPAEWEYTGAVVPGYPILHPIRQPKFWEVFWSIYWQRRQAKDR